MCAMRTARRTGKPRQLSAHQARNAGCVWGGRRCQCGEIPADGTIVGVRRLAPRARGVLHMGPRGTPVVRRNGVADAQRRRQRKLRCREQHRHEARPPAWANHLPEAYAVTRREAIVSRSGSFIRIANRVRGLSFSVGDDACGVEGAHSRARRHSSSGFHFRALPGTFTACDVSW